MFDELNFMNDDEYDLFFGFHEDEVKELENQAQKLTDKYIAEVDKAIEAKTQEILTV